MNSKSRRISSKNNDVSSGSNIQSDNNQLSNQNLALSPLLASSSFSSSSNISASSNFSTSAPIDLTSNLDDSFPPSDTDFSLSATTSTPKVISRNLKEIVDRIYQAIPTMNLQGVQVFSDIEKENVILKTAFREIAKIIQGLGSSRERERETILTIKKEEEKREKMNGKRALKRNLDFIDLDNEDEDDNADKVKDLNTIGLVPPPCFLSPSRKKKTHRNSSITNKKIDVDKLPIQSTMCSVCGESIFLSAPEFPSCNHNDICSGCLRDFCTYKISKRTFPIYCHHAKCFEPIPPSTVLTALGDDEDLKKKFTELSLLHLVQTEPENYTCCPTPGNFFFSQSIRIIH